MNLSLQKASLGKRFIAGIFDGIFTVIIAVGVAVLLSWMLGYNGYFTVIEESHARYEAEFEIDLQLTQEEYNKFSEQEKKEYREKLDALNKALAADDEVNNAYNMLINLSLIILTFSLLIGVFTVEFIVPLFFKNGQTLGKKIFGIALMHTDFIKVNNVQLFVRTVLGKFAIELMIPTYIILMVFAGLIGIIAPFMLIVIILAEIICFATSGTHALIHDSMAKTVAVDIASQRIFETEEAKTEYINAYQAELAARSDY